MKNVLQWLEESEIKYSDKTVYSSDESSISFSELKIKSQKIGSGIIKKKFESRIPIAVALGKDVKTIAAFLGVVYSGRPYAPIDIEIPEARILKILESLNPAALVTDSEHEAYASECLRKAGCRCSVLNIDELLESELNKDELTFVRNNMVSTDPLYIIYTSGSSGKPKGVITSHESLINYIDAYTNVMGISSSDILGNQSPLDYIAAIRDIYVPLLTGAQSYLLGKELFMQPDVLFDKMNEKGVSCVSWSTSALTVLTKLGAFKNKKLTYLNKVCFSGSVMPGKVLNLWQINLPNCKFVNQYGPTEATASCTYWVVEHLIQEGESIPIGIAYDNYRVFLLNDDGTETKKGEQGEICVAGPVLALAYYNDIERTHAAFIQNPLNHSFNELIYKTGDYGSFREDGLLEFHGRMDRQIKHMGHRVELDEIENATMQVQGVKECAVCYEQEKEQIHLFFNGDVEVRDVLIELRNRLPLFMVPRKAQKMELPKLPNGKIDLISLKATFTK